MQQKVYTVENIDCAVCAAKIEQEVANIPGVENASFNFALKKLFVRLEDNVDVYDEICRVADKIEPGLSVKDADNTKKYAQVYNHMHDELCGCKLRDDGLFERSYNVENLCCAICSDQIEKKLLTLDNVVDASVTFTTQKIKIIAKCDPDLFLDKVQNVCDFIRHDVVVDVPQGGRDRRMVSFWGSKDFYLILSGIATLVLALVFSHGVGLHVIASVLFLVSYVIFGGGVLSCALQNILRGQIFDENFLMAIATIGAFAIHQPFEAVTVMLLFRLGETFEKYAVNKSRESIISAIDVLPSTVRVVDKGEAKSVLASMVKVDDVILIQAGDRVPLDGVVIEGSSQMDMSFITGESMPVHVNIGGEVLAGSINCISPVKVRVTREINQSMTSRILNSVENAAATKPTTDRFLTKFARVYTPIVVLLATVVAVGMPLLGYGTWKYWIYTALSFLVVSCPCALVLSVPLAFFVGIGRASKLGILFKGGNTLERLNKIKAIAMDKTGTLTKGELFVRDVCVYGDVMTEDELLILTASVEKMSTHPIARSIWSYAQKKNLQPIRVDRLEEVCGNGIKAMIGEDIVICGTSEFLLQNEVRDTPVDKDAITHVLVARNKEYIGRIIIEDELKSNAFDIVTRLKQMGMFTAILTGDTEQNARVIANEVGVDDMYARLLPSDKVERLEQIRREKGPVLFIGDGVNDAPVLANADVGAAMGSGADAALEYADMVYMNSDMLSVLRSILLANRVCRVSTQNIVLALTIKFLIVILGLCGFASMWAAVFADTGVAVLCVLNSVRRITRKIF